jgi:hypothetical protein
MAVGAVATLSLAVMGVVVLVTSRLRPRRSTMGSAILSGSKMR